MPELSTIGAAVVGLIALGSLVMALARTPPNEAKTNLTRWMESLGIHRIPVWLKSFRVEIAVSRISVLTFGVATAALANGLHDYFTTKFEMDKLNRGHQLKEILKRRDEIVTAPANEYIEELQKLIPPKSEFLRLTDIDRWRLSNELRQHVFNSVGQIGGCDARIFHRPGSETAQKTWAELQPILWAAGWRLEGGRTAKTVFPAGIVVNAPGQQGLPFDCGYRLAEMLEGMGLAPVAFRANVATPDLVTCNACVEIVFGDLKPLEIKR